MTKMGPKRIHIVRGRGGNLKYRAMRLESGNFAWAGENVTHKTRVIDVVYNASNNELVRTKTLVKGAVVLVDATPFKSHYENHYKLSIKKKASLEEGSKFSREFAALPALKDGKEIAAVTRKYKTRQDALKTGTELDPKIEDQLTTGRLMAVISSRPGQSGRLDGYILEGQELEFYMRKLALKKSGKHA
jgi:small subunit ribosomal protein S8e